MPENQEKPAYLTQHVKFGTKGKTQEKGAPKTYYSANVVFKDLDHIIELAKAAVCIKFAKLARDGEWKHEPGSCPTVALADIIKRERIVSLDKAVAKKMETASGRTEMREMLRRIEEQLAQAEMDAAEEEQKPDEFSGEDETEEMTEEQLEAATRPAQEKAPVKPVAKAKAKRSR